MAEVVVPIPSHDDRPEETMAMKNSLQNTRANRAQVLAALTSFVDTPRFNDFPLFQWIEYSIHGGHKNCMELLMAREPVWSTEQRFQAIHLCVDAGQMELISPWYDLTAEGDMSWISADGSVSCLETALKNRDYAMMEYIVSMKGSIVSIF